MRTNSNGNLNGKKKKQSLNCLVSPISYNDIGAILSEMWEAFTYEEIDWEDLKIPKLLTMNAPRIAC
jgi:hypothetical protein